MKSIKTSVQLPGKKVNEDNIFDDLSIPITYQKN